MLELDNGMCRQFDVDSFSPEFPNSTPREILDAIEEWESLGAVSVQRMNAGAWFAQPTHRLCRLLPGALGFDLQSDIQAVIDALLADGGEFVSAKTIGDLAGLDPKRTTYAVLNAADQGLLEIRANPGCAPFGFTWVRATARTRRYRDKP